MIAEQQNTDPNLELAAAVKSMNDTLGLEGLVPSALVFGEFLKLNTLSKIPSVLYTLEKRACIANTARRGI